MVDEFNSKTEGSNGSEPTELASSEKSVPFILNKVPSWKNPVLSASPNETEKAQKPNNNDNKGAAIAGFVLSLVGLIIYPLLFGILAIIFSAVGIKSSKKGLAIAGIVIGILDVLFAIVIGAMVA